MAPSIRYLSTYLLGLQRPKLDWLDRGPPWKCALIPWTGPTCLAVICYVRKHLADSDYNMIIEILWYLNDAARCHDRQSRTTWQRIWGLETEISQIIEYSLIPEVQKYFKVPKIQHMRDTDKCLKPNEILASFMAFLVDILSCELLNSQMIFDNEAYNNLLRELTFLLTFLGDTPFQCTELQEVNNILTEFETFANEAGSFIHSFIFTTRLVFNSGFLASGYDLPQKLDLLHARIKDHCIEFSDLSGRYLTSDIDCVVTIFTIDSLLENLDNFTSFGVTLARDGGQRQMEAMGNKTTNLEIMDQPSVADGFKYEIKMLYDELMMSRNFLQNLGETEHENTHELRECVVQIRDAAHQVEYLINSLAAEKLPIWYVLLRLPGITQKIQLSTLNYRVSKITPRESEVLKLMKDTSKVAINRTTKGDTLLVGIEERKTTILDHLTGGSRSRQVISIFGMPGLGKTTMSKILYDDQLVYYHFHTRAWCVVSQTYQRRKVLNDIYSSLTSGEGKNRNLNMDDEYLGLEIYQTLLGKTYLIVMDDVWSLDAWEDLKRFFPDQGNGSRIILTSRIKNAAPSDSTFVTLPLLSENQCFSLLVKKVFQNEPCPPQLQIVTRSIGAKCRGLPLAIVVMAGILSNLKKEESVWGKVEKQLESYIFEGSSEWTKVFELSYHHLPNHLKLCFLYFGTFPEDAEIPLRELTWLWISEGFICLEQDKRPEQVAEECLLELIGRSLVVVTKRSSYGGIRTCSIHDLLREMCLRRCHDGSLFKFRKINFAKYSTAYHLLDHSTSTTGLSSFNLHCHSLSGRLLDPSSYLAQMPLLRVVDQFPSLFEFCPPLVVSGRPIHLKYLSVDVMPYEIGDFQYPNLKFLSVRKGCEIPSSIFTMINLTHLRLGWSSTFSESSIPETTNNLEYLGYVSIVNHQHEEILKRSPRLRKLKCQYSKIAFPEFGCHSNLESLTIRYSYIRHLDEIKNISFPQSIKKLNLRYVFLSSETMSTIGRLPHLHVLKLVNSAFLEEKWETMDGEFEELRFLKLEATVLKYWTTSSEHFPKLQRLVLIRCPEMLQEIPTDLGYNPSLQIIEVHNCSYEASLSAFQIEEEQRDNGNEDLQVIIAGDKWSKEELIQNSRESSSNKNAGVLLRNSTEESCYKTAGELLQNCEESQPIAENSHHKTGRTGRLWFPKMGKLKWKRLRFS